MKRQTSEIPIERRHPPARRHHLSGLALSLLIFRAGGEPIAQKALTGLARNSGFVTRAMALEFGVSAGRYRRGVHAAHSCRSAG
ncbi:MAG: hypothetical protein ACLSGI_06680 [Butyricicoccaceae bacterium]